MFDSVIFASWPRGLYLAKQLSEKERKVAYVEIWPRQKNPFGFFGDEQFQEAKEFLEALGFLSSQEGGFCLLSSDGIWPFQNMREMANRHPVLKRPLKKGSFKDHWLAYLSFNLAGKVFEHNNSDFSDRGLNFYSDYFLFEPSFKKIKQFQRDQSHISFYSFYPEEVSFNEKDLNFLVQGNLLEAEKYFWFGGNHLPVFKKKKTGEPYWQWSACFFEVDFGDYEDIIPSHFVSIKNLFLPWSHDNLLSVFHKKGQLEVWFRRTYRTKELSFLKEVKKHLEAFFPGCVFSPVEKETLHSFPVYSQEHLHPQPMGWKGKLYREDLNDFFQGDLANEIRAEKELFQSL